MASYEIQCELLLIKLIFFSKRWKSLHEIFRFCNVGLKIILNTALPCFPTFQKYLAVHVTTGTQTSISLHGKQCRMVEKMWALEWKIWRPVRIWIVPPNRQCVFRFIAYLFFLKKCFVVCAITIVPFPPLRHPPPSAPPSLLISEPNFIFCKVY